MKPKKISELTTEHRQVLVAACMQVLGEYREQQEKKRPRRRHRARP